MCCEIHYTFIINLILNMAQKIVQLDKTTKKVIKIWDHYTEPAKFYNLCKNSIYASLNRDNNQTCDTLWTYYNPNFHKEFSSNTYYVIFKNNKYYKTFLTLNRVGRELGMSDEYILNLIQNNNDPIYSVKTIN